jgi:hypothetical protein
MDDDKKQQDERAETRRVEDRERTVRNVVMLLIVAALVGIGVWVTNALTKGVSTNVSRRAATTARRSKSSRARITRATRFSP